LKYAQRSVLNTGVDNQHLRTYEELLKAGTSVELNQTLGPNFSRNFILVKIDGGPISVNFVDLPGIIVADESILTGSKVLAIANSPQGSGDGRMVQLVQNLSATYLDDPKCLTLLTIDMNGMALTPPISKILLDIETQSASALAREHDRDGNQRIGMPKPCLRD